ncbi:MBL fold metallo-hydrolase [Kutzneria buriramensis]|uniref:L-ascorbate metabolism protein UlaG (Beta-lactamase superfamily) n=1 Tax=Kutzneria buriramensis TaxID=1045776 RepID=A0A3E0I5K8_9PSEU|nr:MBL fold metallo-hydrolase [Kutzneria buriramensis]REH53881.1 L-ascorbate metabolism protein UlaG (beta-lactamase superfamily) [Kutzneria buriramensis]
MRTTVQFVGGPTALLDLGGVRLLTDPTFDPPGDHPIGNRVLVKHIGPAVMPEDVGRVDAVLLSHDQHPDNLDDLGREFVGRAPLVLGTAGSAERLGGTARELPLWQSVTVGDVRITGVPARHGPMGSEHLTGEVRGFVLSAPDGPRVYVSGDNASLGIVQEIADNLGPIDIAVLFGGRGRSTLMDAYLTLGADQMARAAEILDASIVVPIHVDGWGHFTETRDDVPAAFAKHGLADRLVMPAPGEVVILTE